MQIRSILRSSAVSFALCLLFPALSARAQVVVQLGLNFTATTYGTTTTNSPAIPPDAEGAVGPNHYVELINGIFCVYSKTDGHRVLRMSDLDFWGNAGVAVDTGDLWETTDPRIIYDPASKRWFATQVDVDVLSQLLFGMLGGNHFLLAVSETDDPTGLWNGVSFDSDPDNGNFADFPTLGLDSRGVYISGDMFDATADPTDPTVVGLGPSLVSIPKADLLAIPPVIDNLTWFGIMNYSDRGYALQPAVCVDGTGNGSVLSVSGLGVDNAGNFETNTTLVNFNVQNAAGPGAATLNSSTFITVPDYTAPIDPTQPDGTSNLADNDARISALVYQVGGVLYAVHNTEVNDRAAIRWYRINATNHVLLESGTITDADLDLFFPSIAANTNGTVVICCNGSSIDTFVSCYAIVGETLNGVTSFGSLALLKSGEVSYHGDDELGGADESRWGDYSATSVDPSDPSRFWTIQMFPSDTDVWSTQVTELLTAQLKLAIAISGTNAVVSWPSLATGYQLQSATNLVSPAAWSIVTLPQSTNGSQLSVLVPVTDGQKFFRLKKQ